MKQVSTAVIIVAGGSGSRMGADVPKQFLQFNGKPILAHTLLRFREAIPGARVIVVLPRDSMAMWDEMVRQHLLDGTHTVCAGGATRYESVQNAIAHIGEVDYVAIHDGVRPLASVGFIRDTLDCATRHGMAIPAVVPVESFRTVEGKENRPIDRSTLRSIQTPQIFAARMIRDAYGQPHDPSFTDDASVVERAGHEVVLCEGQPTNIKITTPSDLIIAKAILKDEQHI